MTAQQKITREVLENYLHCKTKAFLTLTGEFGNRGKSPGAAVQASCWRCR